MASIKVIAATLWTVVKPGMKPKELCAAVRERHPEASKKEIVRAAFFALTDSPISGSQALADLHNFALMERGQDDGADTDATVGQHRKKNRALKGTAITLFPEFHRHDERCLPNSLIRPLKGAR